MPTPIGHALAGLTIASAVRRSGRRFPSGYYVGAAVLACLPDAELLVSLTTRYDLHHGPLHTVTFPFIAGVAAALIARGTWRARASWFGLVFALIGSHVLLDLMRATHPASQLEVFWPFSERRVSLPIHVFYHAPSFDEVATPRGFRLLMTNLTAEIAVLGTLLLVTKFWKRPAA